MSRIKLLVMDVDGTLTDGNLYIGNSGEVYKAFNIKDGYGIKNILPKFNIIPVIITGRCSKIVENRCNELGIRHLFQGKTNKIEVLKEISKTLSVSPCEMAYIGDDDNDLECLKYISDNGGIIGCPFDASELVSCFLHIYKSSFCGGHGAVRDFINYILDKCK